MHFQPLLNTILMRLKFVHDPIRKTRILFIPFAWKQVLVHSNKNVNFIAFNVI